HTTEEKETDVNIAIKLFEEAIKDTYDIAMIISSDSDLLPALRAVKRNYPNKSFGVIIPPLRQAELLKKEADFYRKIKFKHLKSCRLPERIDLGDGKTLDCPEKWRIS
ncbi:MAG: NYN domain-containing protein, partial [Chitinispirillaceae bacterium]|nr:NYN domain-containing protein [Chitinispirillaceae bacterium]